MIVRSRIILTMDGSPIENGAVAIKGPLFTDVGTFDEIRARNSDAVLDLGEQILLPGLINAHCHLDYTSLRGTIPPQPSFAAWIRQINAAKAALSEKDYLRSIADGFTEARRFGTTTIVNLEAFPQLLGRLPRAPLRTWWCAELIDVREKIVPSEIEQTVRSVFERREELLGGFGLAPHAPYTASAELYAQCSEIAHRKNLLLTTHLAESREEMQMFREGRGPLFDFMKSVGRPMDDCGSTTPLALLLERVGLDERWLVAHLNELTAEDFNSLVTAKKFHIVHCPCSHRYFGHTRFPLQKLRSLGFNICLGTDSLATTASLSLFEEMRELQRGESALAPREIIEMVTVNSAKALRLRHSLGRIKPGYFADLISIPTTSGDDVCEQIIGYEKAVSWIMIGGHALDSA